MENIHFKLISIKTNELNFLCLLRLAIFYANFFCVVCPSIPHDYLLLDNYKSHYNY